MISIETLTYIRLHPKAREILVGMGSYVVSFLVEAFWEHLGFLSWT